MCALVLALRKIPIYAPGGGDSVLGSSDKPTYSVAVTDAEAATNREAFAKTKEGKRLVPTKKPDNPVPIQSQTKDVSTSGADVQNLMDPEGLLARHHHLSTPNERDAINTLNTRHPAADTAEDPSDLMESDVQTPGSITPQDPRRSADLEEMRGLLHRQSTRGKRKTATDAFTNVSPVSNSAFPPRMEVEYVSYPPQTLDPYLQPSVGLDARPPPPQALPQVPGPPPPPPQMQQLPQIPRPVPGSGNSFAQQAKEDRQQRQSRNL